eukprot:5642774-Prymnesium_polylepis.1
MRGGHGRGDGRAGRVHSVRFGLLPERDGRHRVQTVQARLILPAWRISAAAVQRGLVLERDRPGERDAVHTDRCGLHCSHGQRGADG